MCVWVTFASLFGYMWKDNCFLLYTIFSLKFEASLGLVSTKSLLLVYPTVDGELFSAMSATSSGAFGGLHT